MTKHAEAERDLALVQCCLAGDEQARRDLFRRFLPQVRGVLYRLLGPDPELQDLTQEAMLKLFKGIAHFRGESSLHTWADRVCVNVALQDLRRRGRRVKTVSMSEVGKPMPTPEASSLELTERSILVDRVYQLLEQVSPPKRVAFLLYELGGLTAAEIAVAADVAVSTVKSRIWYARKELHQAAREDPQLSEYIRSTKRSEAAGAEQRTRSSTTEDDPAAPCDHGSSRGGKR